MADTMAKSEVAIDVDELVCRAGSDAESLGRLYDKYYQRVYRFCVHRLFYRETAEDVTATIFLQVARQIGSFKGRTEADFRNWLYAIAANHANSYIRTATRQRYLLENAAKSLKTMETDCGRETKPDWSSVYQAILRLKPKYQTIVTLRFFENMEFEEIGKIINARPVTVRVTLHRILKKLRDHLQNIVDGEK